MNGIGTRGTDYMQGELKRNLPIGPHTFKERNSSAYCFEIQERQGIFQLFQELDDLFFINAHPTCPYSLHLDLLLFGQDAIFGNILKVGYTLGKERIA